jgi:hypothetical protein
MAKSRPLFTDGWNSFWHFLFGFISIRYVLIMPFFVLYQLYSFNDVNLHIDLVEYFIGYLLSYFLVKYNIMTLDSLPLPKLKLT